MVPVCLHIFAFFGAKLIWTHNRLYEKTHLFFRFDNNNKYLNYFAGLAPLPGRAPTSWLLLPRLLYPGDTNSQNVIKHDTKLSNDTKIEDDFVDNNEASHEIDNEIDDDNVADKDNNNENDNLDETDGIVPGGTRATTVSQCLGLRGTRTSSVQLPTP